MNITDILGQFLMKKALNFKNVSIFKENVNIFAENVDIFQQSKVKESKVKKSKVK